MKSFSNPDDLTTEETICSNELPYRWGEVTFTEAGTETQTFVSSVGCDSTVTLTLHVNPSYNETDGKTPAPAAYEAAQKNRNVHRREHLSDLRDLTGQKGKHQAQC